MPILRRDDIRNVAIIAHVDHGKTTLVDHLLRQSGTFRENQHIADRVMDSNDLERERGITIMAKNTAVQWHDKKINIVDTPGHSDFGGEVERILGMVDGVVLLVDAAEGPLPQTKFVLKKSLDMGLAPIVVINKIDRKDARPEEVLDEIMELFLSLGAHYDQLNFPTLYAIAKEGIAKNSLADTTTTTLDPLFEAIVEHIPRPKFAPDEPFQMLISAVDWSDYIGRIGVGRIERGTVRVGDTVCLMKSDGSIENSRLTKLFVFEGLKRTEVPEAQSGDIVALAGFEKVNIGDTIASAEKPELFPYHNVDEPTITMNFMVNNSPFAGMEGKFVTTPKLRERLFRELRTNVSLRIMDTDSPDVFKVSARGELQLAILIETMRREGYEFAVSKPEVIFRKNEDGKILEPIEHVVIDVPETYLGVTIENLGRRRGEMFMMINSHGNVRADFYVPSRGLLGFRSELLTQTRGTGLLHQNFHEYQPFKGNIDGRSRGALIAMEPGEAKAYAMESIQERGVLFIEPTEKIYSGMVVGENSREADMTVNVCKAKHLTNMRASGTDGIVRLAPARKMSLEQCIEFLGDDELLEVTPINTRIRKRILDQNERKRASKKIESGD